ncbi:uncharacterized protein LOC118422727 isoform X1 [Branchiostoma floridae]|uniref:Large ribosomal subunit protein mL38 n=1 Tax=Branchiostoma floridae TaxID=7739 RepID=A0A9J7LNT6_BRAFL|nr:uncharacterized protein LOC118422727 isoform X1 [Branchiostoma floridae]
MLSTLFIIPTLLVLSSGTPDSWVPPGDLPVNFTVTFSAPETVYNVCNRNFTQSARNFSVDTTGVVVTPGETANAPTMTIAGASSDDMFSILMIDSDGKGDVGLPIFPILHMLITNITNADPSTGAVIDPYGGPMPPPCIAARTYHYLLFKQTSALSLTVADLPTYTPNCSFSGLEGQCNFEVANFMSTNNLTTVGYVTMVAGVDGYSRWSYVNNPALGRNEASACQGLDGYDPCPTAPPSSSGKNVMVSMSAVMASALCLILSFTFVLN